MIETVGYLLAVLIGVSLGLLGGGGSVLALPVLVYIMQVEPKSAIAMTLVIVGSVSFLGCLPHLLKGKIPLKIALIFGTATTIGAYGGAKLAVLPFITSTLQMSLFGVAMLSAASLMIYRTARSNHNDKETLDKTQYVEPACQYCWLWLVTEGLGVGILTGLVGVGGGFAIVPALVLLGEIPMKQAIGTSLLIIACNAMAGLLGYLGQVSLDWPLTLSFTFLAALGTLIGSHLVNFVSAKHLQKGFGYFLFIVAGFVLVQNLAF
ncbi:MAG: sulfite exporter TauE/SafE family protein [Microcystaceae cyanobacterium]